MGFYGEHVLPRVINVACGMKNAAPLRRRVCEGLEGNVVEIGFGSGHNVPFYPEAVSRVAAIEPADVGWKLAEKRLRATSVPVERSGLDGQSLPFASDSFDSSPGSRAGSGQARAVRRGECAGPRRTSWTTSCRTWRCGSGS